MNETREEICGKCGTEIDPNRRVDFTLKDGTRVCDSCFVKGTSRAVPEQRWVLPLVNTPPLCRERLDIGTYDRSSNPPSPQRMKGKPESFLTALRSKGRGCNRRTGAQN